MAGCMRLIPKEIMVFFGSIFRSRAADVATPDIWQMNPSRGVSSSRNLP